MITNNIEYIWKDMYENTLNTGIISSNKLSNNFVGQKIKVKPRILHFLCNTCIYIYSISDYELKN